MASTNSDDRRLMQRAIDLAKTSRHVARPNPAVGCVIARDGRIVGEGATAAPGGPHAERVALAAAADAARGAVVYVTLEPCAHHGRTPPCTEALIAAGVAAVHYAVTDPNPAVNGRGAAALAAAGIAVETGLLGAAAQGLIAGFATRIARGRPRVTLKSAASLDGATAMASGESQWITGPEARARVQALRARSGAVLTGRGTVVADDPALTVRDPRFADMPSPPVRVVVATDATFDRDYAVFDAAAPTLLYTAGDRRSDVPSGSSGEAVCVGPDADGRVDLAAVLTDLGQRGINDVLVEAGPTLSGALLLGGLIDEWRLFLAPCALGSETRRLFETPALSTLAERREFELDTMARVGPDLELVLTARPLA